MPSVLQEMLHPYLTSTQAILVAIVVGGLWFLYLSHQKKKNYWKDRGMVHFIEPAYVFGIGKLLLGLLSINDALRAAYDKFPEARMVGTFEMTKPKLMIRDPELLRKITVKEFDSFHDHSPFISPDADKLWGKNLFATSGPKWRDLRTTLSPSFTSSKMKMMFSLMDDCAKQFVDYILRHVDEEFEMKDILSRFSNDVIASTAFGLEIDSLEHKDNEFYQGGKKASTFGVRTLLLILAHAVSPSINKVLGVRFVPQKVANYFTSIIKETIESREAQHIVRPDMIHLLMEARKGRITEEETLHVSEGFSSVSEELKHTPNSAHKKMELTLDDIVSQAFVFFLAGFDTVSTFLTFLFYEVAVNPDIQSRLRDEINSTLPQSGGRVTYEALLSMKYLDMVVSETLRRWPPATMTDRIVTKPFTIQPDKPHENPLDLEVGIGCTIPVFAFHTDPRFYPEPTKFDPERFSDENRSKIVPFTYLPFGLGPRNCIGSRFALLEGKLLIFNVLKEFEIVPVKRTHIPMVLNKREVTLTAEGGMWLGFKKLQRDT